MKKCARCNFQVEIKDAGAFFNRISNRKSGFYSYCRSCSAKDNKKHSLIKSSKRPKKKSIEEKFHDSYYQDPNSGCWLWTVSLYSNSKLSQMYGTMRVGKKQKGAHRLSWEIHFGEIPDGLVVMHKCDTPPCVNPRHLRLGTHKDNAIDAVMKGRSTSQTYVIKKKKECKRGHEYNEKNTDYRSDFKGRMIRICRICQKDRLRKRWIIKKEALAKLK